MKFTKALILINLFFLQSYLIRFKIGGFPTNLQEILIGLTFIIFLIEITKNRLFLQTVKNILSHKVILSFIALTAISLTLISTRIIEIAPPIKENLHLIRHVRFLFFAIILSFIFLEIFKKDRLLPALKFAGFGAILFGLFSIIYNLLGYNVAPDNRLLGPLDAAVYLSYYLTPFFLLFSIEFINNTKKKTNLIFAIILGLMIIATLSMGSIGGSFLILLIYIFRKNSKKILKSKIAKFSLILTSILVVGIIFYTKILPTIKTPWSSLDERGEIWQTSVYILENPKNLLLGVGFGQFEYKYIENVDTVLGHKPLDYYVIQPHNIFLLFIFHYGILGLIFLIFAIYKTIKNIINLSSLDKISEISTFILLYFFIHGLIDTPFFKNDMLILLVIFMETALNGRTRSLSQS